MDKATLMRGVSLMAIMAALSDPATEQQSQGDSWGPYQGPSYLTVREALAINRGDLAYTRYYAAKRLAAKMPELERLTAEAEAALEAETFESVEADG